MVRWLLVCLFAVPSLVTAESAHRSCLESTIWAYDLQKTIYETGDEQFDYIASTRLEESEIDDLRQHWIALLDASEGLIKKLSSICAAIEVEDFKR